MTTAMILMGSRQRLERSDGTLVYDVFGRGPLVVCTPGPGDIRSVYRYFVPYLVRAGYRVATMDLRGHGESHTGFRSYDGVATGSDQVALTRRLGGPAVLVGSSISAGSAVWAAAHDPADIAGLVLISPQVRDRPEGYLQLLFRRLRVLGPLGRRMWATSYSRLYRGNPPPDLSEHLSAIVRSLKRPGAWRAFMATTRAKSAPVEGLLGDVRRPTLVVMGEADPAFPDAPAEARRLADRLHGDALLVRGAGHCPQAEYPEAVAAAVLSLLQRAFPSP